MVWLDIENHDLFYSDCNDNYWYVSEMLNQCRDMLGQAGCGVYASASQWNDIMCGITSDYNGVHWSDFNLWYPHYDNNPSFSDFSSFGGWSSPNIKQYWDSTAVCSTTIDYDWY